ncbi:MAG: MerR family transcriptional regulator [Candidatus Cyclonatronum sp.]|uniref:MerR family transcriptional regulator n=1 Tax=Cyclonatronum sp. TaxID=3024185 RepID=UPI0025B8101D|nr:MerR family transcriptional regulator [Cyclonatronum sp.]MCC5935336.1 MerR family transcriptional regulator [Balneolales bacterium]MCH8487969.1 MerR family transcriptional regulator [Cyclonatronum sp.]
MEKLYYKISEVSRLTGVEPHVLRYWESVFEELSPAKNRAGNRIYSPRDIDLIMELKILIRDKQFSTSGAQQEMQARRKKPKTKDGETPELFPKNTDLQRDLREVRLLLQQLLDKL